MYPLKGTGIVLFLPCRRNFSDYLSKTLPFYFRCRCAGADLQEMCSIAPLQRKATFNPVHPVGRKGSPGKLVSQLRFGRRGTFATGKPRPGRRAASAVMAFPQKCPRLGVLRGKTLERRTRPSAFGADRVFPLSVLLVPFRTSEKELALEAKPQAAGPLVTENSHPVHEHSLFLPPGRGILI